MPTILLYTLGLTLYTLSALASYGKISLSSTQTVVFGATAGAMTHVAWLFVARLAANAQQVFVRALVWDIILTCTYATMPLILGAPITKMQLFGAFFVCFGVFLLR